MKRTVNPFCGESVRLRLIEEMDLETTLAWRNRDDARIWFKTSDKLTLEQHKDWFYRYRSKDDDFLFVVEAQGKLVGQVSVYNILWDLRRAEVGRFLVAPDSAKRGYIRMACSALMSFCQEQFALNYLYLDVIETNSQAFHVYNKIGFAEEYRTDNLIRMACILQGRIDGTCQ